MGKLRTLIDPYLLLLIGTIGLAALFPAHGSGVAVADAAVTVAVALLFFLYGARLAPQAIWQGMAHWRLQLLVFLSTFLLFPLIGLAVVHTIGGFVAPDIAVGLLFLCVLPSTVQSSIAFTSIARGNVPAALCSASLSNLVGVALTPVLTALLLPTSASGGFSPHALESIAMQILLPFAAGQVARPFIGNWLARYKKMVGYVDRGSILLVVYAAFSAGMVAGVWTRLAPIDLLIVLVLNLVILALVIAATTFASRKLGFSTEDEITIVFCGSKKSMASGIPMATILFAGHAVSLIVLPLMLFHQAQLFVCATLARRYAARPEA
ncbi:bile acid:sodium symporter family protein [Novosphingobium pokkalii]|uniref:Bile acid:sodium symporter family protein n=1 Tax=Novosphingobium pokkalii TaxID=1770194 RepID=A0ABV7V2E0_9SPHN|nr:bile acid:sodium symporter family protein [Novosphingobium pokkalii]GHC83230.1 bile acid:sodium symporter [Novosphingobium pokkalii]